LRARPLPAGRRGENYPCLAPYTGSSPNPSNGWGAAGPRACRSALQRKPQISKIIVLKEGVLEDAIAGHLRDLARGASGGGTCEPSPEMGGVDKVGALAFRTPADTEPRSCCIRATACGTLGAGVEASARDTGTLARRRSMAPPHFHAVPSSPLSHARRGLRFARPGFIGLDSVQSWH
jgi:hypothetical protein